MEQGQSVVVLTQLGGSSGAGLFDSHSVLLCTPCITLGHVWKSSACLSAHGGVTICLGSEPAASGTGKIVLGVSQHAPAPSPVCYRAGGATLQGSGSMAMGPRANLESQVQWKLQLGSPGSYTNCQKSAS